MTKTFSALAIAAAALSTSAIMFSPAAYAAEAAPQALVSWHDLDLRTDAGRHTLARRTEIAARKVCPDQQVTGTRLPAAGISECRAAVRTQVAQRVTGDARMALRN